MAIPSIISATPSGNELQFVTGAGLKPVAFGIRVTDTNLRTFSKLSETSVVVAWDQDPSNLKGYDPNNSWSEEWTWATASNERIDQTFTASDGFTYICVSVSTNAYTKIYKVNEVGSVSLVYTYNGTTVLNYLVGNFAENSEGVHIVLRDNGGSGNYLVLNLNTSILTSVVIDKGMSPTLHRKGDDIYLLLQRASTNPYTLTSYKQTNKALNTWTLEGTNQGAYSFTNIGIMSNSSKFYCYYNVDGSASFPNKIFESTDLINWTEVVDLSSRTEPNSRIIQNDSLYLDSTEYIVVRDGTPDINDDSTAYLYYFGSNKLVPLSPESGWLESASLDFNELVTGRLALNNLKSATAYPILKIDGVEVEYSVSEFTDTTFNVDLGATPPEGEYSLWWIDGSFSIYVPPVTDPNYTLSTNGLDFELEHIEEGYESSIRLPWTQVEKENKQIRSFDDGSAYDIYTCRFSALMTKATYELLRPVYEDNKDQDFTLVVNGGGGFSPFTPAYGDQGTFTFKIKSLKQSGTLDDERYQWFRISFEVVNSGDLPSYSPISSPNEGVLQIGTIGGLRYPIGGYQPSVSFDVSSKGTAEIVAYSQDWANTSEISKMNLRILFDKMSSLVKHLLSERTNQISILVPSGHYPYGAEGGDDQSFNSRLISKVLRVKHVNNKRYEISLDFQRVVNE